MRDAVSSGTMRHVAAAKAFVVILTNRNAPGMDRDIIIRALITSDPTVSHPTHPSLGGGVGRGSPKDYRQ